MMTYDPATRQMVWFGGAPSYGPGQTWVWSGSNWSQLKPSTSPPSLYDASMAFDPATNQLILFGGDTPQPAHVYDWTWTWNGSTWSRLSPAHQPEPRYGASMAFDPSTNQLILFGGAAIVQAGNPPVATEEMANDTWAWNGSDWVQLSPRAAPIGRWGAAMTYDPRSKDLILYGGNNGRGTYYRGTWGWNGGDWIPLVPDTSTDNPGGRFEPSLGYDDATSQVILFGGLDSIAGDPNPAGTWTWTGSSWVQLSTPAGPSERYGSPMVYDPRFGYLILAGGVPQMSTSDFTWAWEPATTPAPTTTSTGGGPSSDRPGPTVPARVDQSGAVTTQPAATTHRPGTTPRSSTTSVAGKSSTTTAPVAGRLNATSSRSGKTASAALHPVRHPGGSILWFVLGAVALVGVGGSAAGMAVYRRRNARSGT